MPRTAAELTERGSSHPPRSKESKGARAARRLLGPKPAPPHDTRTQVQVKPETQGVLNAQPRSKLYSKHTTTQHSKPGNRQAAPNCLCGEIRRPPSRLLCPNARLPTPTLCAQDSLDHPWTGPPPGCSGAGSR